MSRMVQDLSDTKKKQACGETEKANAGIAAYIRRESRNDGNRAA